MKSEKKKRKGKKKWLSRNRARTAREKSISFRGIVVHRRICSGKSIRLIERVATLVLFFSFFSFFYFFISLFLYFFHPLPFFFFVFNFRLSVGHGIALSLSMVTPHCANTREECRIGWVTGWTCLSTFWNAVRPFLGVSSVIERVESKRKREKEATLHRNNQLHCNARCGIIPGI